MSNPQPIDSALVPEWMRQKRQQDDLAAAIQEAQNQRQIAATLLIQKERMTFWKSLLQNLKVASDALPTLKMTGAMSPIGLDTMRIQVSRPGVFANFTHTDLFLTDDGVRCNMMEGGYYEFQFCVVSDTEVALMGLHRFSKPMNPEQIAEQIVRRMLDLIEGRQRM